MKCTLVPSQFYDENCAGNFLAQVFDMPENTPVKSVNVPSYDAWLVYAEENPGEVPAMLPLIEKLPACSDYNKIMCCWKDGELSLAIAQGKTLLLCNVFRAEDFTTAEYFIFLALKQLQLNPEVSTICWMNPLDDEQQMSLFRYFKGVETCV